MVMHKLSLNNNILTAEKWMNLLITIERVWNQESINKTIEMHIIIIGTKYLLKLFISNK